MSIFFSHPTGNQFSRAALKSLQNENLLSSFYTSVAVFNNDISDQLANFKPFSELRRRKFDDCLKPYIKQYPYKELVRIVASKLRLSKLTLHEKGKYSVDAVYHYLDRKVGSTISNSKNDSLKGVYAYEDGALNSFKAAKQKNILALYDLPIGYWRTKKRLLSEEKEKQPEWAMTLTSFKDSKTKLYRKDEELALADHIFVASQFTANSLMDYPTDLAPIHVIPYGFPSVGHKREYDFHASNRPLRLLFVGGLSQRKGISYLFEAIEALGNQIELTVVGRKASNKCDALNKALTKHRWIPSLPHHKVLELMRTQDILLFPSLFEGFGLVITEAMSQGTPVITTERTAGPDIITDGVDGWLIDAGSTIALQTKIQELLSNPISISKVGEAAMETARKRPWSVYGQETSDIIKNILNIY